MRGAIFFTIAGIVPGEAVAGPWGQEAGGVFARAAVSGEQIDGFDAWRADLYSEYGVRDKWTLIAKAEAVSFPGAAEFDASEARLVVQRRLLSSRGLVVAAGADLSTARQSVGSKPVRQLVWKRAPASARLAG